MSTKIRTLNQVAKIYSGVSPKTDKAVFGMEGCPWVMVEDLKNTTVEKTSRRLSQEGMKLARISPAQTVFFSRTGTIGKVGIARESMAPSNIIIAVEFYKEHIDPLYGMYCLAAMRAEFNAEARGAVYASLGLDTFRNFKIPVPDMKDQRRIAKKLEKLQQAETLQLQIIQNVKNTIHIMFDKYFSAEVDELTRKDHHTYLGECADILLSGAPKKEQSNGRKVRYITTALLNDWEVLCDRAVWAQIDSDLGERFGLKAGDIVMNRINQPDRLGRCGIVGNSLTSQAVFGLNTVCIRAKERRINSFFLFAWLTHPFIKQYIQENAKNSTSFQSSLSKRSLIELPLPQVSLSAQEEFAEAMKLYFQYIQQANGMVETIAGLQQVWYKRIKILFEEARSDDRTEQEEPTYKERGYWITPSGIECFYDSYLGCIQVPVRELEGLRTSQLPMKVEIQFLDHTRNIGDSKYGSLEQFRIQLMDTNTLQMIWMRPVAYSLEENERNNEIRQQLEETGLISEQQDFGYIRHSKEIRINANDLVAAHLPGEISYKESKEKVYTRLGNLSFSIKSFVNSLSDFQQAIYEEFLLSMQPMACHMVRKQIVLRAGKDKFSGYNIQDVIASVRLLENMGLLERRQGFYLNYYKDYKQGEERQLILDHRKQPVQIDTWVWTMPKE